MNAATARRRSPEDYLMAAQLVAEGTGYQNAAMMTGVDPAVLSVFQPRRRRPEYSPAPPMLAAPPPPPPLHEPLRFTAPDCSPAPAARARRAAEIIAEVADVYGMALSDLVGPSRRRAFAWPRQEAMWFVRHETRLSLPQIGRIFGGRDHTTILHGIRAHEARQEIV